MKRFLVPVASLAFLAAGFGAGIAVSATAAEDDAPAVTSNRQSLAEAPAPKGAPNRTLGLSRVVVMPGAELPSHHHPGTQLGYVERGVLTYTVESGSAKLMKGDGEAPTLIKKVGPGQTVKVRAGQWLIESQGEVHHAVNNGDIPIVIFASTLFRTGAAAAIPD